MKLSTGRHDRRDVACDDAPQILLLCRTLGMVPLELPAQVWRGSATSTCHVGACNCSRGCCHPGVSGSLEVQRCCSCQATGPEAWICTEARCGSTVSCAGASSRCAAPHPCLHTAKGTG